MRVLLSTIGSRGDVQPLLALALQVRDLGQEVRMCVPPDFRDWIEGLGIPVTPIGPELRQLTAGPAATLPSPERLRQLAEETVGMQFEAIAKAAHGCDFIVAATALQIAARSVAEVEGAGYVFAAYCPEVLPSPYHPPPPLPPIAGQPPTPPTADNRELWARNADRFNNTFGRQLNSHRAAVGLLPVTDVSSHIFTDQPWLAADPVLGPWPDPADPAVFQSGAWILADERPLPPELERFLEAGDEPVYFGLGSMRAPGDVSQVIIHAVRELGRRVVLSRGWAGLSLLDGGPDCFGIEEVNQQALFRRVAAAVHHGGAGTTTTAALAGAPQVVIPQTYDQQYWGRRVEELGIGAAHSRGVPAVDSLAAALERALQREVADRATSTASRVRQDGATRAARRLIAEGGASPAPMSPRPPKGARPAAGPA